MGVINQKCTINAHTQKSDPNTTLKIVQSQENKRGRAEKRPIKTNSKQQIGNKNTHIDSCIKCK